MKRYLVIGGRIRSISDGQEHYISPSTLCRLYGVRPADAVLAMDAADPVLWGLRFADYIELSPRRDGKYTLPAIAAIDEVLK